MTIPAEVRVKLLWLVLLSIVTAGRAWGHPGWGVVVDGRDRIFYTDLRQVWKVDPDGKRVVVVPNVHTHELYLDAAGSLYGEHLWYDNARKAWKHYLWELSAAGRLTRHPPQEGLHPGGIFLRDAQGAMYWVDDRKVMKRLPDASVQVVADIGASSAVAGRAPGGILAVAPDGVLYLARGGDLIRIAPEGSTTLVASGLNEHVWNAVAIQPWHYVMGLCAGPAGNVYVANSGARVMKKVGPDRKVTVLLRANFPWAPTGCTVHNGDLYVLEYTDAGSVRVRKVGADGKVLTLTGRRATAAEGPTKVVP